MYDLNGAAIFSALFPLANDGARAWTLGAWLDTHRREVRVVADRAIDTVAADIAAERIEAWLRVELPQRRKRHASGAARSLTWALRDEAMRQRAGLEGARRAVHALGGDDTFDPRDEDAHYDVKRLIERYGADDPPEEEEEADPRPADAESAYYVSAVKGSSWVALAGPFETHREAINAKAEARRQARAKYPRDFDFADIAVGTVRAPRGQNVVLPALQPVAPVPVAPEGFGVEYSRDPTMYVPFPGWDSKDGYKIDGSKVLFWATKKAAQAAARSLGWPLDSVTKVHTRFQVGWALADGRFGLVSREWLTKNLRPEIISGIFASVGLSR